MNQIFRMDGPLYKIFNIVYYLFITNMLWFICSLPIFTAGASTTALFYVMGKVIRDEDVSPLKDFWKSFRGNFRQATVIWLILLSGFIIIYTNVKYINIFGSLSNYILPLQMAIALELFIITIYIFPLLSRFNMTIKNLFKMSFMIANRHFPSTLLCIAILGLVFVLLYQFTGLFILVFVSLYALCSYYVINRVFKKYTPEEPKSQLE